MQFSWNSNFSIDLPSPPLIYVYRCLNIHDANMDSCAQCNEHFFKIRLTIRTLYIVVASTV